MAFDFPQNPGVGTTVTNPATGITYTYAGGNVWLVADSTVAEGYATSEALNAEVVARTSADSGLDLRVTTLENAPAPITDLSDYYTKSQTYSQSEVDSLVGSGGDVQLGTEKNTDHVTITVNGETDKGTQLEIATDYLAGLLGPNDRKHLYTWNEDQYYSKAEIDDQFTLRGVGYKYLMSSFGGSPTIRPGELHTNNRIVGQVTFISMGPEDDDGKVRRDAVVGDTIELYESSYGHFFRYEITSYGGNGVWGVQYVGGDEDRDHPLGMGYPYLVYLYPTHISSANYYDKDASDERFMSLKPGSQQYCQRMINFAATVDYTGTVQYSNNIANKRYVDEQVAGLATVAYVNDEVDKLAVSFSTEDAEPDIYYGDYAPSGERKNGDLWFDSMHLRLNVWSQGAWINPDRNDGQTLENRIATLEARLSQLEGN